MLVSRYDAVNFAFNRYPGNPTRRSINSRSLKSNSFSQISFCRGKRGGKAKKVAIGTVSLTIAGLATDMLPLAANNQAYNQVASELSKLNPAVAAVVVLFITGAFAAGGRAYLVKKRGKK